MDFMAGLTRHFLNAIQPNDFSLNRTVKFLDALSDGDAVGELLWYKVGFLVCAVVAILYMVSMPVIGGILACCRYRGKCGGGTLPKQTSRTDTYRRALYWSVVIATGMVLLGNTYMFKSTAAWGGVDQINGTLNSLQSYFTAVPEQFDHMMDESYRTVEEINRIGPKLGVQIKKSLQSGLSSALESVVFMKDLNHDNARNNLKAFSKYLYDSDPTNAVYDNVSAARKNLEYIMKEIDNADIKRTLEKIVNELNFSEILRFGYISQNVSDFLSAVGDVKWDSLLHKVNDYLENIPQEVTNDTKDVFQPMRNKVEDTKTHISEATRDVLASVSTNMSDTLQQLQRNINNITPAVESAERISRAVGVVLCCLVLLVVGCNVLGLVLGPLGPDPKAVVIVRSSTGHYGGNSLLISAGVIFLCSWLLMGAVLLLFVPGWSMYALVCKPWQDGELLKIIDTPRLLGFELGSMLGLDRNLTLTDVYTDCQKNMSLWSTLYMHDLINPEEPLNVSQYTDVILSNVNLTPIALLSPVESQISTLHEKAKDIDFIAFTQQVRRILSGQLSKQLEKFENDINDIKLNSLNPNLQDLLKEEANNLGYVRRRLNRDYNKNLINNLSSTAEKLRSNVNEINAKVSDVLRNVGEAQAVLDDNNTMQIILAENRAFVDRQLDNVAVKHAEWTNLTQKVARCGPVATAVDSAEKIICKNMVESLNVFWFSLAWCLIFFIPSVIFSIRLAKYYRRMEVSDRPRDDYLSQVLQDNGGV